MYGNLEKLFDLEPQMFPRDEDSCASVSGGIEGKEAIFRCVLQQDAGKNLIVGNNT
jgi:hypothetical protein